MFPIYRNQTYTHMCTLTHNIKTEERLSGGKKGTRRWRRRELGWWWGFYISKLQ